VLKGISVVSHKLSQCTIVERVESSTGSATETRRHYRLHTYTIHKHKAGGGAPPTSSEPTHATTSIALAFPVNADLSPQRSESGELIFACARPSGAALEPSRLHVWAAESPLARMYGLLEPSRSHV
jgi:hypothetical protein